MTRRRAKRLLNWLARLEVNDFYANSVLIDGYLVREKRSYSGLMQQLWKRTESYRKWRERK